MANILPVQIVGQVQLPTVAGILYTVPANTTVKISRAVFCNATAGSVQFSISVNNNGTMSTGYVIFNLLLSPGQAYVSPELSGMVLPSGFNLMAITGTANAVWTNISGVTVQ